MRSLNLKAVGCAFVSLRDNLDLTTPARRMMFHVIGAMAEFQRELIRERVKAGLSHVRATPAPYSADRGDSNTPSKLP
jgi:DNA invertase Pin-like site-specific DNA recombinase